MVGGAFPTAERAADPRESLALYFCCGDLLRRNLQPIGPVGNINLHLIHGCTDHLEVRSV